MWHFINFLWPVGRRAPRYRLTPRYRYPCHPRHYTTALHGYILHLLHKGHPPLAIMQPLCIMAVGRLLLLLLLLLLHGGGGKGHLGHELALHLPLHLHLHLLRLLLLLLLLLLLNLPL